MLEIKIIIFSHARCVESSHIRKILPTLFLSKVYKILLTVLIKFPRKILKSTKL